MNGENKITINSSEFNTEWQIMIILIDLVIW